MGFLSGFSIALLIQSLDRITRIKGVGRASSW